MILAVTSAAAIVASVVVAAVIIILTVEVFVVTIVEVIAIVYDIRWGITGLHCQKQTESNEQRTEKLASGGDASVLL